MKAAIIVFPGTGGQHELRAALSEYGNFNVQFVDEETTTLADYDAVFLAGGASYGDYLRPGGIAASTPVLSALADFAKSGKLVVGFGNGFQILTEANLLPGGFLQNESTRYVSRMQTVQWNDQAGTDYLASDLKTSGEAVYPVAHGFGQYVADAATLAELDRNGQIVLYYPENEKPNGSQLNIAGIANDRGNVIGLMPHPERALDDVLGTSDGRKVFSALKGKGDVSDSE